MVRRKGVFWGRVTEGVVAVELVVLALGREAKVVMRWCVGATESVLG